MKVIGGPLDGGEAPLSWEEEHIALQIDYMNPPLYAHYQRIDGEYRYVATYRHEDIELVS